MLFQKMDFHYGIQIALAMAISITLGYYFELNNPIATGLVTLATIQMTKIEILKVAFRRFLAFIAMIIISVAIYNFIGFSVIGFFVFVIIFSSIISYFGAVEKKVEIDEIHKKIYDILYDRFRGIYKLEGKSIVKEKVYDNDYLVFENANRLLDEYIAELKKHNGNMLLSEEDYYIEYFEMRKRQIPM